MIHGVKRRRRLGETLLFSHPVGYSHRSRVCAGYGYTSRGLGWSFTK